MPPYVDPDGVHGSDAQALAAFAEGGAPCFSAMFHVEGPALLADRAVAAALRLGPQTILVRTDPPEELEAARTQVENTLARAGFSRLDEETLWATPVALQVLGLRLSTWDLWGRNLDQAFDDLRQAALGDEDAPVFGTGLVGGCE